MLVVEGAIPTAEGGRYCYLWPGLTAWDGVRQFAEDAGVILAVGTCSAFGGVVGTVAHLITHGSPPELDSQGRPKDYFGDKVHLECPNLDDYDDGNFGLDACLYEIGCKGRRTKADCPNRQWNCPAFDPDGISEYVQYSKYTAASGNLNPAYGVTEPEIDKPGAYSWVKAPRYMRRVHEVGPLARMSINGDYRRGISAMDHLTARALESQKIAEAMSDWLDELVPGEPTLVSNEVPSSATGMGLTEAPRGALGHWIEVNRSVIRGYQMVTPTAWNASPKDDFDQRGPIEQALVGTPVADPDQPVELLRVVHSFDPCLACSVHTVRPVLPFTGRREGVIN